jgi:hypothetical protein
VFKQSGTNNIFFFFFFLFPLLKKKSCLAGLDHQKLPTRLARRTARMMVDPTLATQQAFN